MSGDGQKQFICTKCKVITTCNFYVKLTRDRAHCIKCGDWIDMKPYARRTFHVWTDEEEDFIRRNIDNPRLTYIVAEKFGVTGKSAYQKIKRMKES